LRIIRSQSKRVLAIVLTEASLVCLIWAKLVNDLLFAAWASSWSASALAAAAWFWRSVTLPAVKTYAATMTRSVASTPIST
jgi:hypothetical protein